MYGEPLVVSRTEKGSISLRPPRNMEVFYLLYRLCGRWAHPWLAVGGRIGLLREAFKTLRDPNDDSSHEWVIANEDNTMVGMVMLDQINRLEKRGRLSYAVLPEFQKQGYASLIARFVVHHGYNDLGLVQIWTRVLRENIPSNKVLDKLNFERIPSENTLYRERGKTYWQDYGIIPKPNPPA